MNAGNITLSSGLAYPVNSQSYIRMLSTDTDRDNRKRCYDQRFYHTLNLSDEMADAYSRKIMLTISWPGSSNSPIGTRPNYSIAI